MLRPYQDVFFTLSYPQPRYEEFTRVGSTTTYQTPGMLYYVRYKDGVRDDVQFVFGSWKKFTKDGQAAQFFPAPVASPQGNISADEVGMQYSFSNLSNTKTTYNVAIRRSTLRFVESYMWENPTEKPKKTKAADQTQQSEPTKGSEDITGYCAIGSHAAKYQRRAGKELQPHNGRGGRKSGQGRSRKFQLQEN